ncbi:MAG: helix-turn-helix transcriptional regulator [Bacteroidales bacterium]
MIQERILLLMKSLGLNPTQFADEIGVQRSSISHIISGRNNPSLDIVTKILNKFPDIDSNWLVIGKGSLVGKNEINSQENRNNEISRPSETLFDDLSDSLFSDIQKDNSPKIDNNNIYELQRKIEILEGKSKVKENQSESNDKQIEIPKPVNNCISNYENSQQSNSTKQIVRIIIFYSDNSFEELTKN